MENKRIVTAEAVRKAHPDKLCDQIADAILDEHLKQDSTARVAVEVFATNGKILIAGEVTSKAKVDYKKIVMDMLRELRYKPADLTSAPDGEIDLEVRIHEQSGDIAAAVDGDKEQGAGDQGIMVGYATNETPEMLPLPVVLAQRICRELDRLQRKVSWMGADGKAQVSVVYTGDKPLYVKTVVVSVQHVALNLAQKKMEEGKDLIRYFSVPCKATKTNDGRTRNLPEHAPDKWAVYKQYNAQDVETERAVRKALESYPLPEYEWELYALDQRINDRGVRVDRLLVKQAMAVDQAFSTQAFLRAKELTGLDNPGSISQLKAWLADQDMPMDSLAKRIVQEKAKDADGVVGELLNLRLELSKTSVKKYEAMARCLCRDGRVHGLLQFGGASRTFRWAGRLVQAQNLPQNHLPDLSLARDTVKTGDEEKLELLFGSVPGTLSELIRTAFIPKDGCRFIVADFSAIEARVLAWLAGEEWVLDEFRGRGKIYEATASRIVPFPPQRTEKSEEKRNESQLFCEDRA